MPRLWNATIAAHRRDVRDAILHTTRALVAENGLRAVTMSQIADEAGIGRATLYKYFPSVDAILLAWHERKISGHVEYLDQVGANIEDPGERLLAVLGAFALILHESRAHNDHELSALLHHGTELGHAQKQVQRMLRNLIAEAATGGDVRADVSPSELASYCLHALNAASTVSSKAAVRRLAAVTFDGLRSQA